MKSVCGRFAPSPTGYMHLGNARTALLAWMQIRALKGKMILRIEDVDHNRSRAFAYDAIREDLEWLGLNWDLEYIQSERTEIYASYLNKLETYPCSCSRKDIREAASAPHSKNSIYPGICRKKKTDSSRPHALRWPIPDWRIEVQDILLGKQAQNLSSELGDIVLKRNDGCYAYHLAVCVDDALMGVTHILRGADLWRVTPCHVALQKTLKFVTPKYMHVPLMTNFQGERLAKRKGAPSLHDLRKSGVTAPSILAELALSLGWTTPAQISANDLVLEFGQQVSQGML